MSKIYVRWGAFQQLAQYRHHCCHKSEKEIAKALDGNYRDEHLFTLKQAVEQYDFYTQQMRTCDELLEAKYGVNVLTARCHHRDRTGYEQMANRQAFYILAQFVS